MKNTFDLDYYEILEVSRAASAETIKAAYKSLINRYHPDKYQPREKAELLTKALNGAYATLKDPVLRENYDRELNRQREDANQSKQEPTARSEPKKKSPANSGQHSTHQSESRSEQQSTSAAASNSEVVSEASDDTPIRIFLACIVMLISFVSLLVLDARNNPKHSPYDDAKLVETQSKTVDTKNHNVVPNEQGSVLADEVSMAEETQETDPLVEEHFEKPQILKMAETNTYAYIDRDGVKNFSSRRPLGIKDIQVLRTEYPVLSKPLSKNEQFIFRCETQNELSFSKVRLDGIKCVPMVIGPPNRTWRLVAIDKDKSIWLPHSGKKHEGKVKAWILFDMLNPSISPSGKLFLSAKELNLFDCDSRTKLTVEQVAYSAQNGRGTISDRITGVTESRLILERNEEAILDEVCKSNVAPP